MSDLIITIGFCIMGYLSGSLTFSLWITQLIKGKDLRESGSGHATTTNTIRQAGWLPGILVFILDMAKGYFPTLLALHYAPYAWVSPVIGGLVVAGHCWPLFADFRGGMGLATAGASILAVDSLLGLIGLGILIFFVLIIKHTARAAVIVGLLLAPIFYLIGGRGQIIWVTAIVGIVISIRFASDWNRQYRELWLDREPPKS
jgi:glycerol-3-phosphate acyltransferase PlsY